MTASPHDDAPAAEVPKNAPKSDQRNGLRLSDEPQFRAGGFGPVIAWAFMACLLTLINRFAGYFVPIPPFGSLTGHLLALVYFAALLFVVLMLTREAARLPWQSGALWGIGLAFAVPMGAVLLMQGRMYTPFSLTLTANNLFLPVAAALIGAAIGRIIKHPNTLLAGAGFAIFFDFVVVTMGTVAQLTKTKSNIINIVSLGGGNPSNAKVAELPSWMQHKAVDPITGVTIGPADVLFLALFQAAVFHQRLSPRATFWWMFGLLLLALALVEVTGLPIPALVPMGVAVLIANAKHAAFTKTERRDLFIGGIFAVFCAALIVYISQRAITKTTPETPLGFTIGPVSANEFYVEPTGDGPKETTQLERGSAGEQAGLIAGDQILRVNGMPTGGLYGNNQLYPVLGETPKNGLVLRVRLRDAPTVLDVYLPPSRPLTSEEQQKFGKLARRVRPK